MNIDVKQVGYSRTLVKWLYLVLREESILAELPDRQKTLHWVADLANRLESNEIMMAVGRKAGVPGGVFWGCPTDGGIMLVHFAVLPAFRGWSAFKMTRLASHLAFDVMKCIGYQMGITRQANRSAIACSMMAGFKVCGTMPRYLHGEDCAIMVRTRHNEHKQQDSKRPAAALSRRRVREVLRSIHQADATAS